MRLTVSAKERIAFLKPKQAEGELGKTDRNHLKAAEETISDGRRGFCLKVGGIISIACAGGLGVLELAEKHEVDQRRKSISMASASNNRIEATEESLQAFIPKFEEAFIKLCDYLAEKEGLPTGVALRIQKLKLLVESNAAFGSDGRNFKTHKKNTTIKGENSFSKDFYYNVENEKFASGFAAYAAMRRFIQFDLSFDYNNFSDMLSALHEINHAYQDIKARRLIFEPGRRYENYMERYTPIPGVATIVNVDDEDDSYSLQLDALDVSLGGDLRQASQSGDLDNIEALSNRYIGSHRQNFTKEQDRIDYITDLYEYILSNIRDPEMIEKVRNKAQIVTADHISVFIHLLSFASFYFKNKSTTKEYLKRFYREQNVVMYENDAEGMFRRVE